MTTWQIVAIACVFAILDVALVLLVIRAMTVPLLKALAPFPAREIDARGVTKQFQSVRVNSFSNFGGCVHISVDERMLHLRPAWLGRVIRFPSASIPWEQTQLLGQRGDKATIRVGPCELQGPAWAFSMAPPKGAGGEGGEGGEAGSGGAGGQAAGG